MSNLTQIKIVLWAGEVANYPFSSLAALREYHSGCNSHFCLLYLLRWIQLLGNGWLIMCISVCYKLCLPFVRLWDSSILSSRSFWNLLKPVYCMRKNKLNFRFTPHCCVMNVTRYMKQQTWKHHSLLTGCYVIKPVGLVSTSLKLYSYLAGILLVPVPNVYQMNVKRVDSQTMTYEL